VGFDLHQGEKGNNGVDEVPGKLAAVVKFPGKGIKVIDDWLTVNNDVCHGGEQ
jgi:hypothetical protein